MYILQLYERKQNDIRLSILQIKDALLHGKEIEKHWIVYVALGTLSLANSKRAALLLSKVAKGLGGLKNVQVLISTGGIDIDECLKMPNLHILQNVPQLDILPHCSLMITHGGLGSVKECIEAGVPMLVYPLNMAVDQLGNSARIVHNLCGLRGQISDSAARIREKSLKILKESSYKENCQAMRRRIEKHLSNQVVEGSLLRLGVLNKDSTESTISVFSL